MLTAVLSAVLSATSLRQPIDPFQLSGTDLEILCRRVWNQRMLDPPIALYTVLLSPLDRFGKP